MTFLQGLWQIQLCIMPENAAGSKDFSFLIHRISSRRGAAAAAGSASEAGKSSLFFS
jgi:hypothetical protein